MKRRDFIKNSAAATTGIIFIDSLLGCVNTTLQEGQLDEYFKEFQDPPVSSRLFVRWWWNGNRLTEKEILRELDVMKEAGIGGVEINPIAFPDWADPVGYKSLTLFEDKWLDMLEVALRGAKQRGMICDMIVGSGWPFGGEFLKKEEQSQMVTIETLDVEGGTTFQINIDEVLEKVDPEIHSKHDKVFRNLLMVQLLPKESAEFVEGEDLMDLIQDNKLSVEVPPGKWVLYFVVKLTGYMAVIHGAPGAAGPVLNHYSKPAVENYLDRISGFLNGKMGNMGEYIRAMFCDSMELEGANWNDDLPSEFKARRGYSVLPYLPFVLKKVGHMGNPLKGEYGTRFSEEVTEFLKRVELDYYHTRIELFKERFIDTFNTWCHKNNVLSRMQAYGRGMHPLEASMEIDLPDSETWLLSDVGREYPNMGQRGRAYNMCNKFVASAAALTGKKVVSCEEITNTQMVFMATLENIKVGGDQSNISGVTHSILHGFNYSPPEAPFPGWIRYGTYFHERNTWWPFFRSWSDYKARISFLLQNSTPRANVAILQPLTDLWLKHGPQRDPWPGVSYPEYQHNLWEAIHQNGSGCDYVSEKILREATFEKGSMIYGERRYHTLIMPEVETIDPKTIPALEAFTKTGGHIVFIRTKPFKSASAQEPHVSDASVRNKVEELMISGGAQISEYAAPGDDLIRWYGKLQDEVGLQPFIEFDKPHKHLLQSPYLLNDHPMFFMANSSLSEDISFKAKFYVDKKLSPWIWNPETGERLRYPTTDGNNTIELTLPRATSLLIVFETGSEGEIYQPEVLQPGGEVVQGAWSLQLEHMNGERQQMPLDKLADLSTLEQTKHFAGKVIYEKTITIARGNVEQIDLGNVQGVSELTLNGQALGTRWYGAHVYNIQSAVKEGENHISISLTTTTGNYLKSLKDNPNSEQWTGKQELYPQGILGPVRIV